MAAALVLGVYSVLILTRSWGDSLIPREALYLLVYFPSLVGIANYLYSL